MVRCAVEGKRRGEMIVDKDHLPEFKLRVAAWARYRKDSLGIHILDSYIDAGAVIQRVGDRVSDYWKNERAFRDYLYDHAEEIAEAVTEHRSEIADSGKRWAFERILSSIDGGKGEGMGGPAPDGDPFESGDTAYPLTSLPRDFSVTDERIERSMLRQEARDHLRDTLRILIAELGIPARDAPDIADSVEDRWGRTLIGAVIEILKADGKL